MKELQKKITTFLPESLITAIDLLGVREKVSRRELIERALRFVYGDREEELIRERKGG